MQRKAAIPMECVVAHGSSSNVLWKQMLVARTLRSHRSADRIWLEPLESRVKGISLSVDAMKKELRSLGPTSFRASDCEGGRWPTNILLRLHKTKIMQIAMKHAEII